MSSDPNQLKVVKEIGRPDILFSLARVPDSNVVFVGSSDGSVYEFDALAEKPEPRGFSGHAGYVTGLVLAGDQLISGAYDGRLIWWNRDEAQPARTVDAHARWIRDLAVSPDGKHVVSAADDMVARVWDVATGKLVHELHGHAEVTPNHFPSMLYACAVSPDGTRVATADRIGHIVVWDLQSGKQLAAMDAPLMYTWDPKARIHSIGGIRSLAFSPDGKLLAAGGINQIGNIDHLGSLARVEIFDWQKQERTHEFKGDKFKGLVERLVFSDSGDWLLATGGDHSGFIKFLDLAEGKIIKQEKAPAHIHDLDVLETGDSAIAVGHGKIVVWSWKTADAKTEQAADDSAK
jgi:WD40 repeat protein